MYTHTPTRPKCGAEAEPCSDHRQAQEPKQTWQGRRRRSCRRKHGQPKLKLTDRRISRGPSQLLLPPRNRTSRPPPRRRAPASQTCSARGRAPSAHASSPHSTPVRLPTVQPSCMPESLSQRQGALARHCGSSCRRRYPKFASTANTCCTYPESWCRSCFLAGHRWPTTPLAAGPLGSTTCPASNTGAPRRSMTRPKLCLARSDR
mmetsp:Transcript_69971/g.184815  ORF Transcript_69971/g.184815 Transcript_69971/m.184815 type:complete len:205 (+) Transcript_69971:3-617(+)